MTEQSALSAQPHTMTMVRNVHRGCPNCFAPGEYKCDTLTRDGYSEAQVAEMLHLHPELASKEEFFRAGWPKLYVPMNDPKFGQPVGAKCPQCGHKRDAKPQRLPPIKIFGRLF